MTISKTSAYHMGLIEAQRAQQATAEANERALAAEAKAREAQRKAARVTTDDDLRSELATAHTEKRIAQDAANNLRKELAAKEVLMLEWMHSNEAFRQLARNYGKKLGISDEQQTADYRHTVLDVAEEDPKFAQSGLIPKVKANLSKQSKL